MNKKITSEIINKPLGSAALLEDGNYSHGNKEIQVENGLIARQFNLNTNSNQLNFDKELMQAASA